MGRAGINVRMEGLGERSRKGLICLGGVRDHRGIASLHDRSGLTEHREGIAVSECVPGEED